MENTEQFQGFPKMGRLFRDVVITEKIDGTNAQIYITEDGDLFVGSRNRWITPEKDNYGFARWVEGNKSDILNLGPGRHFGEWWGSGIQRGYGLTKGDKRLSLFNTIRWCAYGQEPLEIGVDKVQDVLPECVGLVPILTRGTFSTKLVKDIIQRMGYYGSEAAPGYMNPEGIIVYHTAANVGFKVTVEHDEIPKSLIK